MSIIETIRSNITPPEISKENHENNKEQYPILDNRRWKSI